MTSTGEPKQLLAKYKGSDGVLAARSTQQRRHDGPQDGLMLEWIYPGGAAHGGPVWII